MLKPTLATLLALSLPSLAFACPTINGQFERKIDASSSVIVDMATKVENGKYFYSFDVEASAPFLEADGVMKRLTHEGVSGTLRVSCEANWVQIEATEDGSSPEKQKHILLSPTQLQIESDDAVFSGIFTKI